MTSLITDAGLALIADLLISGDPLVITRVEAGTGADPGAPYNDRTALVTPLEDLTGFDWSRSGNVIEIIAQYENIGNTEPVILTELGVYAQSGAGEILYAIVPMYSAQDWIPTEAQLACRSEYKIRIEISADVEVEMFFAASGYLTGEQGDVRYGSLTDMVNVKADIVEFETEQTPITTTGTQPNYVIAVSRLSASKPLAAGFRQKVYFHAVATADATIAITGADGYTVAAINLYADADKRAKPKKQYSYVEYDGTNFFLCSAGGGVALPSPIAAGDTTIWANNGVYTAPSSGIYAAGYAITVEQAATLRFRVCLIATAGTSNTVELRKNGVAQGAQMASTTAETFVRDVTCAAGDQIALYIVNRSSSARITHFSASMLWADLNTEIAKVVQ